ncbi:winged helix-turn-helix domain-containing protein [Glaciecola petra]|uniref:Winged helix-turn-helix domain-containing protein n=1 Tax=Glaciecola petra TaxID=3075602 RepID=A0ABU2ZP44_9ALTE|nr:winged helix-turn-helix domain-containing protein [Aestuariibacter sp. P117]MDT0594041.1 winged helix-turn-helix domain-containing protein [Aestuariibacter sp. P117]
MRYTLNHWQIIPLEHLIENTQTGETHKIEPRSMAVLTMLMEKSNEMVSRKEFVEHVWEGRVTVDESLTRCISELRKILERDAKKPEYIKTIHKKGYKLLVDAQKVDPPMLPEQKASTFQRRFVVLAFVVTVFAFVVNMNWPLFSNNAIKNNAKHEVNRVLSDLNGIREVLLASESSTPIVFLSNNDGTNVHYTIKSIPLIEGETKEKQNIIQLLNSYGQVIWQASSLQSDEQQKAMSVDALIEVLRLLQLYKEAPELALLSPEMRTMYSRALYLIDVRGRENLENAFELLDNIVQQRPDFAMAIVQKAVAARMMSFYLELIEERQQQSLQYQLLLKQAQATAPEHPVIRSLTARLDLSRKNWFEYQRILEEAVEYSPACVICVRNLAEHYLNVGFYQKAETLVQTHLDYFPLSTMMHSFLGQIYNMQAQTESAKRQVKIINALGHSSGSDALAMKINIAMAEGDIEQYSKLAEAMVARYPAYQYHKDAVDAQLRGDNDALNQIMSKMPRLDFNIALVAGSYQPIIDRIKRNVSNGVLRDLMLTHGWLQPNSHLSPGYSQGLLRLKNHKDIVQLLIDIGLMDYWSEYNQWPDYCHKNEYLQHRPNYCPPQL